MLIELYKSWYTHFCYVREQLKQIPFSEWEVGNTRNIKDELMQIMNEGMRPHLTTWSARFRYWYECQSEDSKAQPQELQKRFPQYTELVCDLEKASSDLLARSEKLLTLATG